MKKIFIIFLLIISVGFQELSAAFEQVHIEQYSGEKSIASGEVLVSDYESRSEKPLIWQKKYEFLEREAHIPYGEYSKKYIFEKETFIPNMLKNYLGEQKFDILTKSDNLAGYYSFVDYNADPYGGQAASGVLYAIDERYKIQNTKENDILSGVIEVPLYHKDFLYKDIPGGMGEVYHFDTKLQWINTNIIENSVQMRFSGDDNYIFPTKKIYKLHKVTNTFGDEFYVFMPYFVFEYRDKHNPVFYVQYKKVAPYTPWCQKTDLSQTNEKIADEHGAIRQEYIESLKGICAFQAEIS